MASNNSENDAVGALTHAHTKQSLRFFDLRQDMLLFARRS
jgi:hypothetical protein